MALWVWYGDGGVQGRAGIYSDAGSAPGTLITVSQVVPVGGGFKRMDVPDRLLPAGRYYLAAQSSNTCGFGMGTSSSMINSLSFAVPDWPQTYPGGGLVQGGYELCVWAEYCPADTPTPTPSSTWTHSPTPECVSLPFGNPTVGPSMAAPSVARVNSYEVNAPLSVTALKVYVVAAGGFRVAVYDSAGGNPANRIWESGDQVSGGEGWTAVPVEPGLPLAPGTYWLGYYSPVSLPVREGGNASAAQDAASGGGFPASWSGSPATGVLSLYAEACALPTYTATPTRTPPSTATATLTPTFTPTCPGGTDAFTLQWTPESVASALRDSAAVGMNGFYYRMGGYWRSGFPAVDYYYDWVARYDPATDTWQPEKSMNHARSALAAAETGGRIYAFGGYYYGSIVSSAEVFHPDLGTWFDLTPVPTPVYYPMAASVGTTIYLMGGQGAVTALPNVYAYDTVAGTWTPKAPIPTPCYASSVGVIDGKVYLAGGNGDSGALSAVVMYDPVLNSWSSRASMPSARSNAGFVVLGEHLYVLGGQNSVGTRTATVYRYDPASDAWATLTDLPSGRAFTAAAAVDGEAFINGGLGPSTILDEHLRGTRVCQ